MLVTGIVLILGAALGAYSGAVMVGMILGREISPMEFVLWAMAYLGILATCAAAVGTAFFWLAVVLLMGVGLAVPGAAWLGDRVGMRLMRSQDLTRLLQAIERRPEIGDNYRRVGEIYYERGDWEHAVDFYERAAKLSRDPEVAFYLRKARERLEVGDERPLTCTECGRLSPRSEARCPYCGAELPLVDLSVALGHSPARLLFAALAFLCLGAGAAWYLQRPERWLPSALLLLLGLVFAVVYAHLVRVTRRRRRRPH